MHIGIVGCGRMGGKMALRLLRGGHAVVVHDVFPAAMEPIVAEGGKASADLAALVAALPAPRSVWVMVPHGAPTEQAVQQLTQLLAPGDTLIDGGNSHFKSTVARAEMLAGFSIDMLDVGTSGGVHGLDRGYCLMVGGKQAVAERHAPIFETLAPGRGDIERTPARAAGLGSGGTAELGWKHCGPSGAGHYVKMIHNGIEYGMMQAMAEGFAMLDSAKGAGLPEPYRYDLDSAAIAELWRRGSVITSWLLDLTADALAESPDLAPFAPQVEDSGEGRWTIESAIDQRTPVPVLTAALYERFRSRQDDRFGDRLLSAMRYKFGGHVAPKA
ncbi:MAG: phosphogluconate dehydrogenase (NAD(+)-dependent, decarboxylating) [Novosphingobium sp.]